MRLSVERNPLAMRVRSRSVVSLEDAVAGAVVCQATMPRQWARTMRTNFLTGSSRERIAPRHQRVR
jgi:hypothetical protein